jgi:hypothetical protein
VALKVELASPKAISSARLTAPEAERADIWRPAVSTGTAW